MRIFGGCSSNRRGITAIIRWSAPRCARDNAGLRQRNDALAAEVQDLKSGEAAVEERARSELGMIKPGETFYRVVESQPSGPQADGSQGATDQDRAP